jgi:hypothetical protein
MTLTIALSLGLALSSQAQAPAGGSAVPPPVVSIPSQAQQPAEPKPAGTTGTTPALPPASISPQPAPTAQEHQAISRSNEMILLIERIEMLLSRKESDEGDLKTAGKVMLNRADVAEILAELKQLKIMLQK